VIALSFGVAAGLGVLVRPYFGRWSDREGPRRPTRLGLLASVPVVFAVPWPDSAWASATLVVAALVLTGVVWAPLLMMLSEACAAVGLGQVMAVAVVDLAWPPGNVLGSVGGAAVAQLVGQRVAYAALAALLLGGFVIMRDRPDAGAPAAAPGRGR
jgi:predicted MFS family arabinose efflux permease